MTRGFLIAMFWRGSGRILVKIHELKPTHRIFHKIFWVIHDIRIEITARLLGDIRYFRKILWHLGGVEYYIPRVKGLLLSDQRVIKKGVSIVDALGTWAVAMDWGVGLDHQSKVDAADLKWTGCIMHLGRAADHICSERIEGAVTEINQAQKLLLEAKRGWFGVY